MRLSSSGAAAIATGTAPKWKRPVMVRPREGGPLQAGVVLLLTGVAASPGRASYSTPGRLESVYLHPFFLQHKELYYEKASKRNYLQACRQYRIQDTPQPAFY